MHESVKQHGMADVPDLLITHTFGRAFTYLPRTGSTNDVAKQLARQGAPEGTVVVADEQTAGRGGSDGAGLPRRPRACCARSCSAPPCAPRSVRS